MRISHTTVTNVLGPGKRFVIWVQGCNKRCKGCINPEGWLLDGGFEISVNEILSSISEHQDIVGVTISGGEPFLQYDELKQLIRRISDKTLDIMLYSGYLLSELYEKYPDSKDEFFPYIDLFIDGEYKEELNNGTAYRGSDNQKIYSFTNKYASQIDDMNKLHRRDFAFELKDGSDVIFVGIPPRDFYDKFIEEIGDIKV